MNGESLFCCIQLTLQLFLKAGFQLRVFDTHVYARKSLNLSKFHTSSDCLNKFKVNHLEKQVLNFYSFISLVAARRIDFDSSVGTHTYEKRLTGKQPLRKNIL